MGLNVARSLLSMIKETSPFWYGIIADEAKDVAHKEQLNVSIRWLSNDYDIHEDPIGLCCLPNTKAETLYTVITDILAHCCLPLSQCRGQSYNGASNMKGSQSVLATRIRAQAPAAVPTHCFAHCLNLCLQDAGKNLPFLRDAIELVREIVKIIKYSPKRAHLFSQKIEEHDTSQVSLKPLCTTRWTARTNAIGSVLTDYGTLMSTLDEIQHTTKDEYGTKAAGLLSLMENFATLFDLKLRYFLFGASETLSKTLQSKDITLQQAICAVNLAKAFYKRQRESFDHFYDDVVATALKEELSEPQLPRYRRVPSRVDDGSSPHRFKNPKDYYRQKY